MATLKEITVRVLTDNKISENTAKDAKVLEFVTDVMNRQNKIAFGVTASEKVKRFFNFTSCDWNPSSFYSKGINNKPKLSEGYAYFWIYNFLHDAIKSNHSVIAKKTENADEISGWPSMNKSAENYDYNFNLNHGLGTYGGNVQIWVTTSILDDVITFSEPQLLNIGDVVKIDSVDYTIVSEDIEGLTYTIDTVMLGNSALLSYEYNFSDLQLPFNRLRNLEKAIGYR